MSLVPSWYILKRNKSFVALFPKVNCLLQPMDIAVFQTLKSVWREQVHQWRVEHQNAPMARRIFAPLFEMTEKSITPNALNNGFKRYGFCGIHKLSKIFFLPWEETEYIVNKLTMDFDKHLMCLYLLLLKKLLTYFNIFK